MLKYLIVLSLATLSLGQATTESQEYCKNAFCQGEKKSVACTYDGIKCKGEIININIKQVLGLHNELRSKIATGQQSGFPTATKMGEVQWNVDLAKLAEFNVATCKDDHDACRGTKQFPSAGQNLAKDYISPPDPTFNVTKVIEEGIRAWYSEVEDCDVKYITKFDDSPATIGHFTQLVWESANFIGCAAIKFYDPSNNSDTVHLTCNYAYGNMMGSPVYTAGEVGKDCTALSTEYKGLCAKTQVYTFP